jgi:hypothetical protein
MASEAQILANRQNAQKSTGPRSPEGKDAISQNAVKHGLTARQDVISSESQADFDLYRDRMLAELAPDSPMESMLAERIVSLSWRLKRAGRIQNQAIDALNADNKSNPLAKLAQSIFFKGADPPQSDPSACDRDMALGRMAIKDFSHARVLDRLLMYERRIEHSLYKTVLELQRLLVMRKLDARRAADKELVAAERAEPGTDYESLRGEIATNYAKQSQFP